MAPSRSIENLYRRRRDQRERRILRPNTARTVETYTLPAESKSTSVAYSRMRPSGNRVGGATVSVILQARSPADDATSEMAGQSSGWFAHYMMTLLWPYGTLFAVALAAATVLPAQSEALLAGLIASGRYNLWLLLAVASAGNTLGAVVNWGLGRFIESFRDRRWFPVSANGLLRAERWYRRWGVWSLLLSWAPIFGDALTVVAGMLRVRLWILLVLVLTAKTGRYLVVAYFVIAAMG